MLGDFAARPVIPALDIERARRFYGDTLGLAAVQESPGGIVYEVGGKGRGDRVGWPEKSAFLVYPSPNPARGGHTQMGWLVDDVLATVAHLRGRGVQFEEYDQPGLKTVDGVAPILGGKGLGAWFKDSEGNLLGLVQFGG